ncbi:hypothetical protein [Vibrio sp. PNB22_4_2]
MKKRFTSLLYIFGLTACSQQMVTMLPSQTPSTHLDSSEDLTVGPAYISQPQQNETYNIDPDSPEQNSRFEEPDAEVAETPALGDISPPEIIYYGANIGQFPQEVRDWITNKQFSPSRMEPLWALEPHLKAWWSEDGNVVRFEASYTVAQGYQGAGQRKTWGKNAYYSGGQLSGSGTHSNYRSFKSSYDIKLLAEYLLENDPAYAEVINFAKQLSNEIEYDWTNFSAYQGAKPSRTPGKRYAVCSGYSSEVMAKVLELEYVSSVEEWASPNHSWNVITLVDGRRLYLDVTWFDNEHINHETGEIIETSDYGWANITFDQDVFNYTDISYGTEDFTHAHGQLVNKLEK